MIKKGKRDKKYFIISLYITFLLILFILKIPEPNKIVLGISDNKLNQQKFQYEKNSIIYNRDQKAFRGINPSCGQVVQGYVKLISNLICGGDGLIVGNKNSQINLNGFSIKGPGLDSNKVGIMIGGQENVSIFGNGIISGFQSGIYISGGNHVSVKDLNINNNKVGIYLTGANDSTMNNNMIDNNTIGMASHSSSKAAIKYNQLNLNKLSAITFINTKNSSIYGNNILNTTNGIFIDPQSSFNNVNFNNIFNNILDLNNANNLPININNNYYSDNNCITSLPSGLCIGR